MKRLILLLMLVCMLPLGAHAENSSVALLMPQRYALLVVRDVPPERVFDEKTILAFLDTQRKKLGVWQISVGFYAQGKKPGDGVLAAAFYNRRKEPHLHVARSTEQARNMEMAFAYDPMLETFYAEYRADATAAAAAYKDKPVLLDFFAPWGVEKDATGPYLRLPPGKSGFGLRLRLAAADPLAAKIKKNMRIKVRAFPRGLAGKEILLDGTILDAWKGGKGYAQWNRFPW